MNNNQKSWWRPVWSGLVIDSEGKHLKQMGSSIWLYLYLLMSSEPKSGTLVRFLNEISQETGIKKNTVKKWLAVLKSKGYIQCQKTSQGLLIHIRHYKVTKRANELPVKEPVSSHGESQIAPREHRQNTGNFLQLSQIMAKTSWPYVRNVKDRLINNVNDNLKYLGSNKKTEFIPQTKEELLAQDLSRGLNDTKNIRAYFVLAKTYPEPYLRRIYEQVKEMPEEKIKKSKGALFTFLIQKLCDNQNDSRKS